MVDPDVALPQIAILGAGIFVRTQYIPRLKEIADRVIVKSIWSRSEVCELIYLQSIFVVASFESPSSSHYRASYVGIC